MRAGVSFELSPHTHSFLILEIGKLNLVSWQNCGILTENHILLRNWVLFCSKVLDCVVMKMLSNAYSIFDGLKFLTKPQIII